MELGVDLHLGKKPATTDDRDLMLSAYLDLEALPELPKQFGHASLVGPDNWQMLGNDQYGDCVWAGHDHASMLWTRISKTHADASFSAQDALADYAACTGFDPNKPNTDRGTDMRNAALYVQKVGLLDVHGRRHRIGAFAAMTPGELSDLDYSIYLFACGGVGIEFPSSAMDQFNRGTVWDYVKGSSIEGGHYILAVEKKANGNYGFVTWGREIEVTPNFLDHYMDEGFGYISSEFLAHGISPEGFNHTQLLADLRKVQAG